MKKRDLIILVVMALAVFVFVGALLSGLPGDDDGGFGISGFGKRVALVEIDGQIGSSDSIVRQIRHWAAWRPPRRSLKKLARRVTVA
jgi:hypothetical protein